jgi:hypothetical protein
LIDDLLKRGDVDGFSIDDLENMYVDPSNWNIGDCRDYLEEHGYADESSMPDPNPWGMSHAEQLEFIRDELDEDSEGTLNTDEALLCIADAIDDESIDGLEEWRQAVQDIACDEPQEAYEWYPCSSWLCEKLRAMGEIVIDNGYGQWWGRGCTGQSIELDPTFWSIFQDGLNQA